VKITAPSLKALREWDRTTTYVYAGRTDRPGNGITRGTLSRLMTDHLITLGPRVPGKGRPILITDTGRSVLRIHAEDRDPADDLYRALITGSLMRPKEWETRDAAAQKLIDAHRAHVLAAAAQALPSEFAASIRSIATDDTLLKTAAAAVIMELAGARDMRSSLPFARSGLVVAEEDGTPSDAIRLTVLEALRIAVESIATQMEHRSKTREDNQ
jgi:hypothetical protein